MHPTRRIPALLLALIAFLPLSIHAQQKPNIAGTYTGMLGNLHVKLHIKSDTSGALTCTLDSPDQNALDLPCADIHLSGQSLTFNLPIVNGTWQGTVSPDGASLTGTWNQGAPLPLNFDRESTAAPEKPFVPAAKPSRVDGIWLGTLQIPSSAAIRVQLHDKSDSAGNEYCTLDSVDEDAGGLPCANIIFKGGNFSFDVPAVKGGWAGTLSADGNTLTGTWTQNDSLPLNLARQAAAIPVTPTSPPTTDAAMTPVDIDLGHPESGRRTHIPKTWSTCLEPYRFDDRRALALMRINTTSPSTRARRAITKYPVAGGLLVGDSGPLGCSA